MLNNTLFCHGFHKVVVSLRGAVTRNARKAAKLILLLRLQQLEWFYVRLGKVRFI